MLNFFHKLLNPHCLECKNDYRERMICDSCETLEAQLEAERYNNRQLLNAILEHTNPKANLPVPAETPISINLKNMPWKVRQQMLEEEDAIKAKLMRDQKRTDINVKTTEELEEMLLGPNLRKQGEV